MKHLKLWESHQTVVEVAEICKQLGIQNWSINSQGLVDVEDLLVKDLISDSTHLPLQFGEVKDFYWSNDKLVSLKGSPRIVRGNFYIFENKLKTLEGGPQIALGSYNCNFNELTTLQGAPNEVGRDFSCTHNNLTSLEGSPQKVGGNFNCVENFKLTTLKGAPQFVGGYFLADLGYLTSLQGLPRIIEGKPVREWAINNINIMRNGEGEERQRHGGYKLIKIDILHTIPDYALTPKLLNLIKKVAPEIYNILKRRREKDQRWKTDLTADMGNLGFD